MKRIIYVKGILLVFATVFLYMGITVSCKGEMEDLPQTFEEETSIIATEVPSAYEAELYVEQEISELAEYEDYICEKSKGQAYLEVWCNRTEPIALYDNNQTFFGYYYPVFADEKWKDHTITWDSFYVCEDFREILWCDVVERGFYSLEEWRGSSRYRDRMERIGRGRLKIEIFNRKVCA